MRRPVCLLLTMVCGILLGFSTSSATTGESGEETTLPGMWPYLGEEEPEGWVTARIWAAGRNMMGIALYAKCKSIPEPWSCRAFQSEWLDANTSFPPEWNARWTERDFQSNGYMVRDDRGDAVEWVHEVTYFGIVFFDTPQLITVHFGDLAKKWRNRIRFIGFESGDLVLNPAHTDDELNPPIGLRIVDYSYWTDVENLDLRERIYVRLDKADNDQSSYPYSLPIHLVLTHPGQESDSSLMAVYRNDELSTQTVRVYTTTPSDIRRSKDFYTDVAGWQDGTNRILTAYYETLAILDTATVHRAVVDISGPSSPVRGTDATYKVAVDDPSSVAFFIKVHNGLYRAIKDRSTLRENHWICNISRNATWIGAATRWSGKMVADGKLTMNIYFDNNPDQDEDDTPVILDGGASKDSLNVVITPRNWDFDPAEQLRVSKIRPLSELPGYDQMCPPVRSSGYPYKNLIFMIMVDQTEQPGANELGNFDPILVTEGPCKDLAIAQDIPFTYILQPYMYSDILNRCDYSKAYCKAFVARLLDAREDNTHNELGLFGLYEELERSIGRKNAPRNKLGLFGLYEELEHGIGWKNAPRASLVTLGIKAIESAEDADVNQEAEKLIYVNRYGEEMDWRTAFKDSLQDILQPYIQNAKDAIKQMDINGIHRLFPNREPQWPNVGGL